MAKAKGEITGKELLIAYNIRAIRGKTYSTIKKACDAFGVHASHWSHWETATVTPFKSTMEKLAAFFKVKPDYFYAEPEGWPQIKQEFVKELRNKARTQKDCYSVPDEPMPVSREVQPQKAGESKHDEALTIFLEIYGLINAARKKVDTGAMAVETYDRHMKNLNDIVEASIYGK